MSKVGGRYKILNPRISNPQPDAKILNLVFHEMLTWRKKTWINIV